MSKENKTQTEKQIAFNNYAAERDKLFDKLVVRMNNLTNYRLYLRTAINGGFALFVGMALLFTTTNPQKPVYDSNKNIIGYEPVYTKNMTRIILAIATVLLCTMAATIIKIKINEKNNHISAKGLAKRTYQQYFNGPLANYLKMANFDKAIKIHDSYYLTYVTDNYVLLSRAAALVLNNLPETETKRLRDLAIHGLNRDKGGKYTISPRAIAAASEIISNFIAYNPEIGSNVLRIMHTGEPNTYFLPKFQAEKTR